MKKVMTIFAAMVFCGLLPVFSALAAFIADNYIGTDYTDVRPEYVLKDGDVITNNTNLDNFDINGMAVNFAGGVMTFDITSMLPSDFTGARGAYWGMTSADAESRGGEGGGSVPLPAAVWLLGSGLLGLVGIRWRSSPI